MTNQTLFTKLSLRYSAENHIEEGGIKYSWGLKIFIMIITVLICSFFFTFHFNFKPEDNSRYNLAPGTIWANQTILASFSFPIMKDFDKYTAEVRKSREKSLYTFLLDESAEDKFNSRIKTFINLLNNFSNSQDALSRNFSDALIKKIAELPPQQFSKELKLIDDAVRKFYSLNFKQGIVNIPVKSIKNTEIAVIKNPNLEKIYAKEFLIDSISLNEKAKLFYTGKLSASSKFIALELTNKLFFPKFIFSAELSEKAREAAEKSVARTDGLVRKGETVISKGEIITEETIKKLNSYNYSKSLKNENFYSIWIILGSFGHALFIYLLLGIYLFFLRPRIIADNLQFGTLNVIIIIIAALSWLSVELQSIYPIEYFVIIPAMGMLVAIVYDSRTAFYAVVTMSLMFAGIRGNDYDSGAAMLFTGAIAAYTVRDIQSRTQMFKSIFFIFIGFVVTITVIGFEHSTDFVNLISKIIISSLTAIFSPLITFGLIFILERTTDTVTDLRIKEFDNLNHPLLVKLSELAPGSYQHTLSLAVLSARCARIINANELLTKVGAYFHDIGKMVKPEYFIENQTDADSKHDRLTPKKSAEAIKNHVLEGIRLTKEYKVPQRIIDFIPMHHGTMLTRHFYAVALEEAKEKPINEDDYRYPGPKPNSKETAIVMICDSAEALSRVGTKDRDELLKAIERTIRDRLIDGQFDECDLTMTDIQKIKETCVRYLLGITHQRVEYKEIPDRNEN